MSPSIELTPAAGSVGAYVEGVDLRCPSPEQREAILAAWHRYGVLFFRGQHLDPTAQLAAAAMFGEPGRFDFAPAVDPEHPLVHRIEEAAGRRFGGISTWHTDATWSRRPPRGSVLQAIDLPSVGGDTLFASGWAAYRNLSAPVRSMIDGLDAEHHGGPALGRAAAKLGISIPEEAVVHPVVRVHPDTGERCLFVNELFTQRIIGLTRRESNTLLPMLWAQFNDPEVQCRFRWEVGDVAVWDNRSVMHYASPDYDEARLMHRVVLAGDEVVGPG